MKKVLTAALAIVLFAGASQAQTSTPGKSHPRGEEMMKDLNLTDAQKTQLKSLHQAEKKERDDLKTKGNATPEDSKALHEKYRSQFDALLTPEQREKLKNTVHERRPGGGERGGRGFDRKDSALGKRAPFMNKELNLTAEQQTKLKGYADDFRAKAKDIRAASGLTEDQKKEQMRTLSKTYRDQSKAVLTPEQQQKMKGFRGRHKPRAAATT